jgi:hypothetical protein
MNYAKLTFCGMLPLKIFNLILPKHLHKPKFLAPLNNISERYDADRLGNMSEQERHTYVQHVVGKVHPELQQPGMIQYVASIAWGNYEWSAGGCTLLEKLKHILSHAKAQRRKEDYV